MRNRSNRLLAVLIGLIPAAFASVALAQNQQQQQQPQGRPVDESGTVEGVQNGLLQVKAGDNLYVVKPGPMAKVSYEGTADADFLKPKTNVKFSGAIDAEGNLQAEIAEMEIYVPQSKTDAGLFNPSDGADAKPQRNAEAGTYLIKGMVGLYKAGEITVTAGGKKITGKVSPSVAIKIATSDYGYAQQGDLVKLKGRSVLLPGNRPQGQPYAPAGAARPPGQPSPPQYVLGEEVAITGAKPLSGAKKGRTGK